MLMLLSIPISTYQVNYIIIYGTEPTRVAYCILVGLNVRR